jgi:hypothetical protein
MSPVITIVALGQGFHVLEASIVARAIGERIAACRGLSPWQVIQRIASELGRVMSFLLEASNKLKRQGGGMATWQSDQPIVEG